MKELEKACSVSYHGLSTIDYKQGKTGEFVKKGKGEVAKRFWENFDILGVERRPLRQLSKL